MSALPLIDAVEQAGGRIMLLGEKLKLSAPLPLPQALLEQLRLHKADVIQHLQSLGRSGSAAPAAAPDLAGTATPPLRAIPDRWRAGVDRLRDIPVPPPYPQPAWQQLMADAELFLARWAAQAAGLGWQDWELFGCHRRAPWHRLDGMGLVPALQGRELAALTASEAVIRTARGARLTHRRKRGDLLHPAERCLVWELS